MTALNYVVPNLYHHFPRGPGAFNCRASQTYPCYFRTTSQNQSQAQILTNKDRPVVAADQCTSQFLLGGPECRKLAYVKTSSSGGGGAQAQPQKKDKEKAKEKSKVTSESSNEDDYILDEFGCPDITKRFYCLECGGQDENGKCKGDPEDNNMFKGCRCHPDPDWSKNPPGLVRPDYRKHQQAIRDRHLLPDDDVGGPGRAGNVSRSDPATVIIRTPLPSMTVKLVDTI
ncbi:uncharacterized protein BDR25DRAFT_340814 [Lindgomyces ingoldianus]|uniref:Uncharacterized protein n=1 Tax=Lindgomyces ingoldianus TaxID=673940 RepID=A0ACB6R4R1_9PLEO|nr:uncharacterized protein BDR25DRAFT_340814 [Lindgomyces ingoldianus]KAF2474288.1 hypothetical protein BDR25DRAFT_340814 [Lindgomyces ingoldianus]